MAIQYDSTRSATPPAANPFCSATHVAQVLQLGDLSALELLEMLLERITCHNAALNAIVTLDGEAARTRARAADLAIAEGQWWGSLHGVPITLQDSFETAGLRTVGGYPPLRTHVPEADGPPVARLRAAGAIVLGKTNLPTLASGTQTDNPVFGGTNNPWNLACTPGGSAGGAAAAVAAGLSFLDLGCGPGGALAIPAHFCGIYSLKLTGGRLADTGQLASVRPRELPPGWEPLLQLEAFGPLARSINDLRQSFAILAATNALSLPAPITPRVAWTTEFGGAPLCAELNDMMRQFAQTLAQRGCHVESASPVDLDYQVAWYWAGVCVGAISTLVRRTGARGMRRPGESVLARFRPKHPLMQGLLAGTALRRGLLQEALRQRELLIGQIDHFLHEYDVWVCPVFPVAAFTHRPPQAPIEVDGLRVPQLSANLLHNVLFNVSGHPVVTMPIGRTAAGLPVGVQLVGRRNAETTLLTVAEQLAASTGGYQPPPGYTTGEPL